MWVPWRACGVRRVSTFTHCAGAATVVVVTWAVAVIAQGPQMGWCGCGSIGSLEAAITATAMKQHLGLVPHLPFAVMHCHVLFI